MKPDSAGIYYMRPKGYVDKQWTYLVLIEGELPFLKVNNIISIKYNDISFTGYKIEDMIFGPKLVIPEGEG